MSLTAADLQAEFDRGEQELETLTRIEHIMREARDNGGELDATAFGLLPEAAFRRIVDTERTRAAQTEDELALVEVTIDHDLSRMEEIFLSLQLRQLVDKPGERIGRTERGYCIAYPWTSAQEASRLADMAGYITQDAFPEATVQIGHAVLRDGHNPLEPIDLEPYTPTLTATASKKYHATR